MAKDSEIENIINICKNRFNILSKNITKLDGGIEHNVYKVKVNNKDIVIKEYLNRNIDYINDEINILNEYRKELKNYKIPLMEVYYSNENIFTQYDFINGYDYSNFKGDLLSELSDLISDLFDIYKKNKFKNIYFNRINKDIISVKEMANKLLEYGIIEQDIYCEIEYFPKYDFILKRFPVRIIHADINKNNLLFDENKIIALLDFDDSYCDSYIIELTTIIRAFLFDENHNLNYDALIKLLDNVNIKNVEIEEMLSLIRYTCYKFLIYILYTDYFIRKINKPVNSYSDYFKYLCLKNYG